MTVIIQIENKATSIEISAAISIQTNGRRSYSIAVVATSTFNSDQLEIDQIIVAEIEFVSNRFSPNGKLFKKMHNKETTQKPLIHRQAIFMKSNLHSAGVGKT